MTLITIDEIGEQLRVPQLFAERQDMNFNLIEIEMTAALNDLKLLKVGLDLDVLYVLTKSDCRLWAFKREALDVYNLYWSRPDGLYPEGMFVDPTKSYYIVELSTIFADPINKPKIRVIPSHLGYAVETVIKMEDRGTHWGHRYEEFKVTYIRHPVHLPAIL